ncbi:MAG: hypothetical protein H9W82_05010 [Lactobacillus sp.]|nr:hypothetical protein [Lactobacillus sp.]
MKTAEQYLSEITHSYGKGYAGTLKTIYGENVRIELTNSRMYGSKNRRA